MFILLPRQEMKMTTSLPSLRRKILRSFWAMVLLYGVLGCFLVISVQIASRTSPKMIHVNYDSIAAANQMREALYAVQYPESTDSFLSLEAAKAQFEKALSFEEGNITEPGEGEIAKSLRQNWNSIHSHGVKPTQEEFVSTNELLKKLVQTNEKGMFQLANGNEQLSRQVLIGSMIFFLISLITSLFVADGLAMRISMPLKNIAEALHRRPMIGRKLKFVEPNTLELMILTNELTRMWERVTESEKVNIREIVEQKSKLESVLESVEDALLVVDTNGIISHTNECMLQLLGLNKDELIDKRWSDLSTLNENYVKLRSLLSLEMSESTEVDLMLQNTKKQYSARVRKISSPSDGPLAILFLLHDITEKRQRERFRTEFIDMLSHEIKTPLQSLGTATEFLFSQKQNLPDLVQPMVETIVEDVERIKAVANEFVQVTQSHSKVMRLKMELTSLNLVMQDWMKPFHLIAKDRKVKLTYLQEGSQVISANIDRVKFPWVVSNLLSNAIRFTPPQSEVIVSITDKNGAIEIQVKDEGPGVSEADQKHMYEPFFQSTMVTSSGSRGLFGIGLTIAKEVVEVHEGRIEYLSRKPKGSEFRIILPFPVG